MPLPSAMHSTRPLPPYPPEEPHSWVLHLGTAVGLAALAALVCALPATLRVAAAVAGTEGAPRVSVALSAAAFGPMIASIVVLRGARESLRAFVGPGLELRAFGVFLWLGLLLVIFSILGSLLRAKTHHHALAGVTFAFLALAIAIATALVCTRVVAILRHASAKTARALGGVLAGGTLVVILGIGIRFLQATARDPESAGAAAVVVDVLAFAMCAGFAARPTFVNRRALALVGPPIAVAIIALGISALRDRPLRAAIDDHAPAFSVPAGWISTM